MAARTTFLTSLASIGLLTACGGEPPSHDAATDETVAIDATDEADAPPPSIDAGPAVGSTVALGQTVMTDDGERTLEQALGGKPAVLVFTRSVDWCPYCQAQLKGLNDVASNLEQRGYGLFGISYDDREAQAKFERDQSLSYAMLSDSNSSLIDTLDLRDPQYTEGKAVGVPYAATIVIDASGEVVARHVSGDYTERLTNEQLLAMLP